MTHCLPGECRRFVDGPMKAGCMTRCVYAEPACETPRRDSVTLEWYHPMDSRTAAKYHLTSGFVAAELYATAQARVKELERDLDVLATVVRTGSVPLSNFTNDEIIRRTAAQAVAIHAERDTLRAENTGLREERVRLKFTAEELRGVNGELRERLEAAETLSQQLPYIVEYRRKDGVMWRPMAAYDVEAIALGYAQKCSGENCPWEYRVRQIDVALAAGENT